MTMSEFDPMCFGQYPRDKEPLVLHFQFENDRRAEPDVCRYVLVERIPMGQIDKATRRKPGEPIDGAELRKKYFPPTPVPKKEAPPKEEKPKSKKKKE